MGNYSSGRYRTRNHGPVERSLRLDIRLLRRRGFVRPGERTHGTWSWNIGGDPCGSIGFVIDLTHPDYGFAELRFSVDGQPRTQRVNIVGEPCRFGGRRFYFICPRWNDRCEVLCGVGGVFASRGFHRLTYFSQSETRIDRVKRASAKVEARLFGEGGNPIPRGANAARLRQQLVELEDDWNSELVRAFARLTGRYGFAL